MMATALLAGTPDRVDSLIYPGDELGTHAVPFMNYIVEMMPHDIGAPAPPPPPVGAPISPSRTGAFTALPSFIGPAPAPGEVTSRDLAKRNLVVLGVGLLIIAIAWRALK